MTLFSVKTFGKFIASLKGSAMVEQWESHVAKVGGKVFALISQDGGRVVFKVSETSFEGLTALEGIAQAPYFARRHWVTVSKGALSDADLKAYVTASYRMVAGKLTRKAKAELGLEDV